LSRSFTEADEETNVASFLASDEHKKLWDRLDEVTRVMPWTIRIVESLRHRVKSIGNLTEKQKSLATKLFIDSCVMDEDRLAEQVATRKMCYRLNELDLGKVKIFVENVLYQTDNRAFSSGQIRAINNIAKHARIKLEDVPELSSENFDGWYKLAPKVGIDYPVGV
jgi:hypothetical protein